MPVRRRIEPKLDSLCHGVLISSIERYVLADRMPPSDARIIRTVADHFAVDAAVAKKTKFGHILRMQACNLCELAVPGQRRQPVLRSLLIEQVKGYSLQRTCIDD